MYSSGDYGTLYSVSIRFFNYFLKLNPILIRFCVSFAYGIVPLFFDLFTGF